MAHAPHGRRRRPPARPADTIGRRAAEVIERQRTELRKHLGRALAGRDPEGVHDMRVASRRLRAALQLFAPWIPRDDLDRVEAAVRTTTRSLGRVRELDVLRLRLAGFAQRARPGPALALEALDTRLEQRRRRARAKMMARFAKVDLDRLDHRLRQLVAHLDESGSPPASAGDPPLADTSAQADPHGSARAPAADLAGAAAEQIRTAIRGALHHRIPEEVGTPGAAEEIHQVRIAAKKLRYLLEVVVPYLGVAGPSLVKRLKGLQDRLGDFHDDIVFDATLTDTIEAERRHDRTLLARELARLRTSRRRALAREEQAVRAAIVALRDGGFERDLEDALAGAAASASALVAAAAGAGAAPESSTTAGADGEPTNGARDQALAESP
jgi:CHAD domain-containing protein